MIAVTERGTVPATTVASRARAVVSSTFPVLHAAVESAGRQEIVVVTVPRSLSHATVKALPREVDGVPLLIRVDRRKRPR